MVLDNPQWLIYHETKPKGHCWKAEMNKPNKQKHFRLCGQVVALRVMGGVAMKDDFTHHISPDPV